MVGSSFLRGASGESKDSPKLVPEGLECRVRGVGFNAD